MYSVWGCIAFQPHKSSITSHCQEITCRYYLISYKVPCREYIHYTTPEVHIYHAEVPLHHSYILHCLCSMGLQERL